MSSVNIFDEESPPVKFDTEEHQIGVDRSRSDASFNIDDIYVPFEEQHRAQIARFVEIEPVAAIGFDAPAGEAH